MLLVAAVIGSVWLAGASLPSGLLLGVRTADAADLAPAVGQKAPEIRLLDQHGKAFVLSDALRQNRFVVVAFYPKAFTGG